jgi:hypothetical protein
LPWWPGEILLGEIDAGMAQDVVGCRYVKKELRAAERQQQRSSGEFPLHAAPEGEHHLSVPCTVDFATQQVLNEFNRGSDARFQFRNIRLYVCERKRRAASQQRAAKDRVTIGFADLLPEAVHIGIEPHVEQHRRIDVSLARIGRRVVQQP